MIRRKTDDAAAARVAEVKKRSAERLRSYPNVVGLGVGMRRKGGRLTEELVLRVYVSRKLPKSELPASAVLPRRVEGIPIDVVQKRSRAFDDTSEHRRRHAILRGGISVINVNVPGSGTLGAIVFDAVTGQQMILSNWHVLCGRLDCEPNERIIQPGVGGLDTGTFGDIVGRLARWAFTSEVDCAVAFLSGHRFGSDELLGHGRVSSNIASPTLGMQVWKSGRTTGVTTGRIVDLDADFDVSYDIGMRHFEHQIVIEGDEPVSAPGDSGSVFVDAENRPVALLFAGDDDSTDANPIGSVVDALRVQFLRQATLQDFATVASALA